MSGKVFVCYSRDDQDFVLELADNLRERGVPIWIDQRDIPPGSDWDIAIDRALYDCSVFLIVLSSNSVDSREVRGELRTALDENKRIVPILIDTCQIPRQLRLIQYINFIGVDPNDDEKLNQILGVLTAANIGINPSRGVSQKSYPAKVFDLSGLWQGKMVVPADSVEYEFNLTITQSGQHLSGIMIMRYEIEGDYTIVQQTMDGKITGKNVSLYGTNHTFIERGMETNYYLDNWELIFKPGNNRLDGKGVDERGKSQKIHLTKNG